MRTISGGFRWHPHTHLVARWEERRLRADRKRLRRLMDALIETSVLENDRSGVEWALIDTRGHEPGTYVIREWINTIGVSVPVEFPPATRHGGAIGLFTLDSSCVSSGPCPPGVDESAGLLLVGFASMLAVPLPDSSIDTLEANWLVVMSARPNTFLDRAIDRLVLLTHALLGDTADLEPGGSRALAAEEGSFNPLSHHPAWRPSSLSTYAGEGQDIEHKERTMVAHTGRSYEARTGETSRSRANQTENPRSSALLAGLVSLCVLTGSSHAQTVPTPSHPAGGQAVPADGALIRPFQFHASEEAMADLRQRLAATRWPEKELVTDEAQGVQLATMKAIVNYWQTGYDWRKVEARLNALPQFVTTIDGVDIHFIHVRSKQPHALPIIITHGWPGSIIEQLKIIEPLTNPTTFGGTPDDAFDVVIPSIPGYGFSGKPKELGWDPVRIARAWTVLMQRLGYTKYVAQGGDWGDAITEQLALLKPPGLLGIHVNMPATIPPAINVALMSPIPTAPPSDLSAEERNAWDQLAFFYRRGLGYAIEMKNKPQTLYGIADSPAGLAAWMIDHDDRSYKLIARAFAGQPGGLSRDDVLDNITLYWLTGTAISSARLYWENTFAFFEPKGVTLPVAVSVFPDEIYAAPRVWTEKAYPHLIHFNKLDAGGHFAAWEQPELFARELRTAFKSLR